VAAVMLTRRSVACASPNCTAWVRNQLAMTTDAPERRP
jgi:hypothetical protein